MSRSAERPVVDMTGLEGQYQFELTFAPETVRGMVDPRVGRTARRRPWMVPRRRLFEDLKQCGLKLEVRNAPIEMLTIEMLTITHLGKTPTEN